MTYPSQAFPTRLPWHAQPWHHFEHIVSANRLPHALLISGPPGIGKYSLAQALAHYLLCQKTAQGSPCGRCRACRLNLAVTHPDLHYLESSDMGKQITIDQVREAVMFVNHTAQQGGMKIVLIAPAHAMNRYAANALLKTLEEPAAHTLFVLVTDLPGQLLPTIRSRCQSLRLTLPNKPMVLNWLASRVAQHERLSQEVGAEHMESAWVEASGQPLTAWGMLESAIITRYQALDRDFLALLGGEMHAINLADQWINGEHSVDIKILLMWLYRRLLAMIRYHVANIAVVPSAWMSVTVVDQQRLFKLTDHVLWIHSQWLAGVVPNAQLLLEALLLESCKALYRMVP